MTIITIIMASNDAFTSIPVHQSTVRALRGVKSADQTWDDLLMALADDYISPALKRELDRRLEKEEVIPGASMKRDYQTWRRRGAKANRR